MADASSSAASTVANQLSGDITINKPNYVAWVVGGLALALVALFLFRRRD